MAKDAMDEAKPAAELPVCGLVMPISAMPGYEPQHWQDVRAVLEEAITGAGMRPQMVSDSFESDVITQRIVANIFNNPVVVVDVSGLNANVMFELGLRLASKKATIIVTDSLDAIPFDTRIIEHVPYPRSLRLRETRQFILDLSARVKSASAKVLSGTYRPFLDNFTGVDVQEAKIDDVSQMAFLSTQIEELTREIRLRDGRERARQLAEHYSVKPDISSPAYLNKNATKRITYTVQEDGLSMPLLLDRLRSIAGIGEVRLVPAQREGDVAIEMQIPINMPRSSINAIDEAVTASTKPYPPGKEPK